MRWCRMLVYCLAVVAITTPVRAHNGHAALAVPLQGIVIDGDLSDWPEDMQRYPVAYEYGGDTLQGGGDYRANFRVGHDDIKNILYVAVEIIDDSVLRAPLAKEGMRADQCEIHLNLVHEFDPNVSSMHYMHGEEQSAFGKAKKEHAQAAVAWGDGVYSYEWAIDLVAASGEVGFAGHGVLQFGVILQDRDAEGSETILQWSKGNQPTMAKMFGDLVLADSAVGRVDGRVRWADGGEGVKYTRLKVQSLDRPELWFHVRSDEQGAVNIAAPAGRYRLQPEIELVADGDVEFELQAGETGEIELEARLPTGKVVAAGPGTAIRAGAGVWRRAGGGVWQDAWQRFGVADNDDQDRFADTIRMDTRNGDNAVFPGWDENNDFISDFNQNDNRILTNSTPDYEEAFLRHDVDRPEFLFGIDMNNNIWIDRFENDDEPDYPYRKDHRGFNLYAGGHVNPEIRVMAGMLREELISADRKNITKYLLFTMDKDTPEWGRFRFFESLKSVEDNIPDDLLQWLPGALLRTGEGTLIEDPLIAPDTWINSLWAGHDYQRGGFRSKNFVKYEFFRQRLGKEQRTLLSLRKQDYFFGLINKAGYRFDLGALQIEPRWKSEYRKQTFDLFSREEREELAQIGGFIMSIPVLGHTRFQTGLELTFSNDFVRDSNDFSGIAWAAQFTNVSAYQGYTLTMQGGLKIDRKDFKAQESETITQSFLTFYAGL